MSTRGLVAHNRKDLTGQKFGLLTVVGYAGTRAKRARWLCQCECGQTSEVPGKELLNGHNTSCGCRKGWERVHGLYKHRFYYTYQGMMKRCFNEKHEAYERYGGRGITVCAEWRDNIAAFLAWCDNEAPAPGLTLDRRENHLGYSPHNCHFITRAEQQKNMRSNVLVTYKGETMIYKDFVKKFGRTTYAAACRRSRNGEDRIQAALRP